MSKTSGCSGCIIALAFAPLMIWKPSRFIFEGVLGIVDFLRELYREVLLGRLD